MDKSWITMTRSSSAYIHGVQSFLEFAFTNAGDTNVIICPCNVCKVGRNRWYTKLEVEHHLMFNGFWHKYKDWVHHGELNNDFDYLSDLGGSHGGHGSDARGLGFVDTGGLFSDIFIAMDNKGDGNDFDEPMFGGNNNDAHFDGIRNPSTAEPVEDDVGYQRLSELADQELFPGSKFSKLSFILHLLHLKTLHGWSIKSFEMLLELLNTVFPQISPFPISWSKCKCLLKDLGLRYEKIHACPNDCILYWDEKENQDECDRCHTSRWKNKEKKVPMKVLRYFPLIPRLLRLYKSSKTAEDMLWHDKQRVKDSIIRHPADAESWKNFDSRYPNFASDPRNVRLALASDGFNPFRVMSSTHSTWPVMLIPYNLPPWLCMKQHSIMLSMIIPGEKAPGMNIDVYLQPLVKELRILWEGVEAFDAYTKKKFKLRAMLHSTINDFPAYANLSGWSTKGRLACPYCANDTHSIWLENGRKFCYIGHRRWLPKKHSFRFDNVGFDGNIELREAPTRVSGSDILAQLEGVTFEYGKSVEGLEVEEHGDTQIWKKRSIFFELPYWEFHILRHNLDLMHIEKNVFDNLLGTFLNLEGKSKDNFKARKDLETLNIRPELHPILLSNGKYEIPVAPYTMSSDEKIRFLSVLKNLKVPDGYASNISRCVNLKERKIFNLKSHDCHILMQDLFPIALRAAKDSDLVSLVSALSNFFKDICVKEISLDKLNQIQSEVVIILCQLEKVFPPGFFTIMVHLIVHLVDEVKYGGPVFYRWMYPIERYLARLKGLLRNRAQPEGSITEGYIAQECINFCSRYFEGIETIFDRAPRNEDEQVSEDLYLFGSGGKPKGKIEIIELDELSLKQAHRYILLHLDGIENYQRLFLNERMTKFSQDPNERLKQKWLIEEFPNWFKERVFDMNDDNLQVRVLKAVANGPNPIARQMNVFVINGYRYHTQSRDKLKKTQNYGVMVEAEGKTYYGKIKQIIELDYFSECRVVLFRCDWVNVNFRGLKKDKRGFTLLNFSHKIHIGKSLKDDPFILSSQASQVFYVEDQKDIGWEHVVRVKPRDSYQLGQVENSLDDELYPQCTPPNIMKEGEYNDPTNWVEVD